jgi:cytochrome c-type biogenesis protein CcmF
VREYTIRMDSLRVTDDGQKQMITGHFTIKKNGEEIGKMYPAKWIFRKHEDQPTTEVAIRRSFAEDLYLVLAGYELQDQTASLEFHINPLVNWIWGGFGLLAIGTLIALLPDAAFSFAAVNVPAGAATTSVLLLGMLLSPGLAAAQSKPSGVRERSELQRSLEDRIMCMCGCRQPMGSCQMRPNCAHYDEQSAKVVSYIKDGKGYDDVLNAFVAEHQSQAVLAAPLDRGFNRLAWLVPYVIGATGLVFAGLAAVRWSRRHEAPEESSAASEPPNDTLDARLDDELRDLD